MAAKVLIELLRGAETRGIAAREILDRYSLAITPQIFHEAMGSVRKTDIALDFFRWAPTQAKFEHDTQSCNALLRVVVDDGRPGEAHRLFTDLLLPLHYPSVASYNLLVRGYCQAGEVCKALRLVKEMKARDLAPDEMTHREILKGFCELKRMEEALEHFRSVIDTSGVDAAMYNTLINGFCKVEKPNDAFNLAEEMIVDMGWMPSAGTCNTLVAGLCTAGSFDMAVKLFTLMSERTKRNSTVVTLVAANALIDCLCKAGRVDEALELVFERCKDKATINAVTYAILIQGLCKLKRVEDGLRLLEEMTTSRGLSPDTATYNSIVAGFCELDMVEQALEFFSSVTQGNKCTPDAVMIGTLVDGLCKSGRTLQALELLEEMDRVGCQPNSQVYCLLIDELCNNGEVDKACKLLHGTLRMGRAPANTGTYMMIVDTLYKIYRPEKAVRHLKWVLGSSLSAPSVVTSCAIIDGLCKSGRFSEARWFLHSMSQMGSKANTHVHNSLLGGLCKAAKIGEACSFFQEMQDEGLPSVVTYNILLDGFCKVVKIEEACAVFVAMVDGNYLPTSVTYKTLVEGFARSGKMAEDYQFAEQRDGFPKGLEVILSRMKNLEPGFQVIYRLVDKGLIKLVTVNSIIRRFCKAGMGDQADKLAQTLVRMGGIPPAVVRAAVTDGL